MPEGSNTYSILVVEDDEKIRRMIRMFLEIENMQVYESEEGRQALLLLKEMPIDLVILDLMMPGLDGWTTCRKIREFSQVPIIFLTARGEESDRVLGFEVGADDYVVKPFSPRELVLRIRALLKRFRQEANTSLPPDNFSDHSEGMLKFSELQINLQGHQVHVMNKAVPLSPLEYSLLIYLASHPNQVFSRDKLLNDVWGYDYYGDSRTVDTHIRRLREKLGSFSEKAASYVATVRGAGYKFEVMP